MKNKGSARKDPRPTVRVPLAKALCEVELLRRDMGVGLGFLHRELCRVESAVRRVQEYPQFKADLRTLSEEVYAVEGLLRDRISFVRHRLQELGGHLGVL